LEANHTLQSVCYASIGKSSSLEVVVKLSCSTSDQAPIKSSLSETITATARIDASDCRVTDVGVAAPGEFSKLLLAFLDANGKARWLSRRNLIRLVPLEP
jgi:hypothetical protein